MHGSHEELRVKFELLINFLPSLPSSPHSGKHSHSKFVILQLLTAPARSFKHHPRFAYILYCETATATAIGNLINGMFGASTSIVSLTTYRHSILLS